MKKKIVRSDWSGTKPGEKMGDGIFKTGVFKNIVEGVGETKDSYFLYALITLVVILGLMLSGAVVFIGVLQAENEILTQENQELEETVGGISEEIRVLSDRIETITRDVDDSEDWNKEAF